MGAASPTPIVSSLAVLNHPNTVKGRGVISGSATNLWHLSSMEDSDVDYVSLPFTPSTTPRPSMAPPPPQSLENNPEICVTNVTGDEIKFVFGGAPGAVPPPSVTGNHQIQPEIMATGSHQIQQPEMAEPMDHS